MADASSLPENKILITFALEQIRFEAAMQRTGGLSCRGNAVFPATAPGVRPDRWAYAPSQA